MATISTLATPIATKLVNEDGTINHVWNEFFVRLMVNAGITVSIADLETETASLQTQIDNIEVETSAAITMSDSDSNPSATLAKLYNGVRTSDGVSYTLSGTAKYIQYKFGVEDYVDRIAIWADNANAQVYIGYSTDGAAWSYLSGESDHTLDSEGRLVTATSQANAALNYFQLALVGENNALFPNNIVAKYIRLYMVGTYTTEIYEFVASRILIAEMASVKNLAAISATFGPVGGYASITDKPTDLSDINGAEGTKLAAIETGATRNEFTGDWADATVYVIGDLVIDNDNGWICILGHTSSDGTNNPPTYPIASNTWWSIYTVQGKDGVPGADGTDGTDGAEVVLTSDRQVTFTATDGTLDGAQSDIVFTATTTLTSPTYVWSQAGCQSAPTASTSSTYTVTAANFGTSSSAIITCAVQAGGVGTTYTNKTTIVRLEVSTAEAGATDDSFLGTGYTTIVGDIISVFSSTLSIVAGVNDDLDWTENGSTKTTALTAGTTYTPTSLAAHVQVKMRAAGDANTTVTYNSSTQLITIANSTLTTLTILWNTGTNAATNCAGALGFSTAADDTGALTYSGDTKAALRVKIGDLS